MENTFKGTTGRLTTREAIGPKGELLYYMVLRNGLTVADFGPNPYSDPPVTMQAAKANAVIYSKAPEMLEMLKLISEKAEEIFGEPDGEDNRFFDEIDFEKLDNLIKSATEL